MDGKCFRLLVWLVYYEKIPPIKMETKILYAIILLTMVSRVVFTLFLENQILD